MNILVIEDELLIQKAISKYLIQKGHTVDATLLGQVAIEKIYQNKYDLIFCDLMLKDITGFDVLEATKSILDSVQIRKSIVLMTAYCSSVILDKAKGYGCIVLEKPFQSLRVLDQFLVKEEVACDSQL